MSRFLVALAAALAALAASANAGSADSQGAANLAAGTGTVLCCGQPMLHVNAQSGEGGVNARGHFWIRYPNGVEFGGRVVCLTVIANQAGLTGHIERVKMPAPVSGFVEGNFLNIEVTDNGSPGTFDLVNFHPGQSTQPASCPIGANLPISQGNYLVRDKPVLDLSALNLLLAGIEAEADHPDA